MLFEDKHCESAASDWPLIEALTPDLEGRFRPWRGFSVAVSMTAGCSVDGLRLLVGLVQRGVKVELQSEYLKKVELGEGRVRLKCLLQGQGSLNERQRRVRISHLC